MNPFRRIATQLNVSLETFLNQVENHEASAECAIREIRQAADKAKSRYHRVRLDANRLHERRELLQKEHGLWTERARKTREDVSVALECVRRVEQIEQELVHVEQHLKQNADLELQLRSDLARIEEAVTRLRLKRNQLASREASADAMRSIDEVDSRTVTDINDIFDRWESKIVSHEGGRIAEGPIDSLEKKFEREEQNDRLQKRLDEILSSEKL